MAMDTPIDACQARIDDLERRLWVAGVPAVAALADYQAACRDLERRIAAQGNDTRYRFVVIIPVADRPQHLGNCLDSLLRLCRTYAYGGFAAGRYSKVEAIVVDDSGDAGNVARHRALAGEYSDQGLATAYLGLSQQIALVDSLNDAQRRGLARVLGDDKRARRHHKGPSLTRNIAYLLLNEIAATGDKVLFHFVDSDQEFQITVGSTTGDRELYAINYFRALDQIFSSTDATVLTGKVVGDPPVSPAVMAGNFLADVVAFLEEMATLDPTLPCRLHSPGRHSDAAAYHDMAALFGLAPAPTPHAYACDLHGAHDHGRCFDDFSGKLDRFFHGAHPTRKTYYRPDEPLSRVQTARTVYTGNYVFRPAGLDYFIPFATLGLRMAGPTLGRLMQAELGPRFVSANLPMLHRRTVRASGRAEFRPGLDTTGDKVDLGGEFERQFYGDVMLFTIERLCATGYPARHLDEAEIAAAVDATHAFLLARYETLQAVIQTRLDTLDGLLHDPARWWNRSPRHAEGVCRFAAFADNIRHNFSAAGGGPVQIHDPTHRAKRLADIAAAIAAYAEDRRAWAALLACHGHPGPLSPEITAGGR